MMTMVIIMTQDSYDTYDDDGDDDEAMNYDYDFVGL